MLSKSRWFYWKIWVWNNYCRVDAIIIQPEASVPLLFVFSLQGIGSWQNTLNNTGLNDILLGYIGLFKWLPLSCFVQWIKSLDLIYIHKRQLVCTFNKFCVALLLLTQIFTNVLIDISWYANFVFLLFDLFSLSSIIFWLRRSTHVLLLPRSSLRAVVLSSPKRAIGRSAFGRAAEQDSPVSSRP